MTVIRNVLLGMAAICLASSAWAQQPPTMQIDQAWARFTVPGMNMGGVFMDIHNHSGRDDELLAAESAAAQSVELHTHVREQGMVRMRPLPGGIRLPQGEGIRLQPGGLHIMLIGLSQPLKVGEHIRVRLKFRHAPPQTVVVPVETGAGRQGQGGHAHH